MGAGRPEKRNEKGAICAICTRMLCFPAAVTLSCVCTLRVQSTDFRRAHLCTGTALRLRYGPFLHR